MPTVCRFVSSDLEFKEAPAEEATRGIGNKVRVLWDPRDARFHRFAGFLACIFRVSALLYNQENHVTTFKRHDSSFVARRFRGKVGVKLD